jgi:hypothetical protein
MEIDSFNLTRRSFLSSFLGLFVIPVFNPSIINPDSIYANYAICEWYGAEELELC